MVLLFFSRSKRTIPVRDGLLVGPADGVISLIEKTMPPPELDIEKEAYKDKCVYERI